MVQRTRSARPRAAGGGVRRAGSPPVPVLLPSPPFHRHAGLRHPMHMTELAPLLVLSCIIAAAFLLFSAIEFFSDPDNYR